MSPFTKKVLIGLGIGLFIPPFSIISANLLIMFGFWYFATLGVRTKIRNYKFEKFLRQERDRRAWNQSERTVDGGVIYSENYHDQTTAITRLK